MPRQPNPPAQQARVLRQFYLDPADDALLEQLRRALGEKHMVRALRYLLRHYAPAAVEHIEQEGRLDGAPQPGELPIHET